MSERQQLAPHRRTPIPLPEFRGVLEAACETFGTLPELFLSGVKIRSVVRTRFAVTRYFRLRGYHRGVISHRCRRERSVVSSQYTRSLELYESDPDFRARCDQLAAFQPPTPTATREV